MARHALINGVRQQATAAEIGGKLAHVVADRLRITRADATRRIEEAEDLGQRQALTGEPVPPRLSATAAAQRAGSIGGAQVRVIRGFLCDSPCWIDADTRVARRRSSPSWAPSFGPSCWPRWPTTWPTGFPDGTFSDAERARRRALILGNKTPTACHCSRVI